MLRLRIISVILSLLMTLQMLPIAQIGSMLSSNQWTEELPHSSHDAGKSDVSSYAPFLPPHQYEVNLMIEACSLAYIHVSERIPSNHSNDVVSPPPDAVMA